MIAGFQAHYYCTPVEGVSVEGVSVKGVSVEWSVCVLCAVFSECG